MTYAMRKEDLGKFSDAVHGVNIIVVDTQDATRVNHNRSCRGERFVFLVERNKKLMCDLCDLLKEAR